MPVNYLLEAIKWQKVLEKVEVLSLNTTLKSVFAGLSVGFITPNNIGDYAGRLSFLKKENRFTSIPLLFISRFIQMLITAWAGGLALFYFLNDNLFKSGAGGLIFVITLLLLGTIAVFFIHKLPAFTSRYNLFKKLLNFLSPLQYFNSSRLIFLCSVSIIRHFVFILQFYLIFRSMNSPLIFSHVFLGTSAALLIKSMLPGFKAMNDMGIREASAIYFFNHFSESSLIVAAVCLIIWFINMVLPALVGMVIIFRKRQ